MPTFQRPVGGSPPISCSFKCHRDRASVNPGVDYAVGTGHDVFAPEAGMVTAAQWSSSVGWWIGIDFDNGWGCDLLHNSTLLVGAGTWVARGQVIAKSGGTGSVATGPHVHWSLRTKHGQHLNNSGNVDGEAYIGAPAPTPPAERGRAMAILYYKAGTTPILYGLAGSSPGTPANWLETTDQGLANTWSSQVGGPSAALNEDTWNSWKANYLSTLATTGDGGSGGDSAATIAEAVDGVLADNFAAVPDAVVDAFADRLGDDDDVGGSRRADLAVFALVALFSLLSVVLAILGNQRWSLLSVALAVLIAGAGFGVLALRRRGHL